MRPSNYYTAPGFERAGLRRRDGEWLRGAATAAGSQFVPVWRSQNLVVELADAPPRAIVLTADHATLLLGEGDPEHSAKAGLSRMHIGFSAASPAEVDGFYAAAIAAGGVDNGPPGYRRPTCYAAFVIDPDGNNVEAVWQTERVAAA